MILHETNNSDNYYSITFRNHSNSALFDEVFTFFDPAIRHVNKTFLVCMGKHI